MAWELCNEPRCEGDFSGSILQDWVEQQAEFLKSLDPFHLLTIGAEGFLGSSTPGTQHVVAVCGFAGPSEIWGS